MKSTFKPGILVLLTVMLLSCSREPQPIKVGKDACNFCKMGIVDGRFGAELITKKGKIYKFDDLHCLLEFKKSKEAGAETIAAEYVVDFDEPHGFIELGKAFLLKSEELRSPMGSNVAGFISENALNEGQQTAGGEQISLTRLNQ